MASLVDIIERNYPQYKEILEDIKTAADSIYEQIIDYKYSEINIVSHLADADGLGSLILEPGLKFIAEVMGKQVTRTKEEGTEDYQLKIQSERIMSVKDNPESEESIDKIKERMGDGTYIFSDVNADLQKEFEKLSKATIMDHHSPLDYKGKHTYINPCNYGFEGEKELSGSILSALLLHYVADRTKKDMGDNKQSKELKKILDKKIDYLTMFGLAGGNADQQRTHGLNKGIYDYYEEKGMLQKEDIPFFGYFTKKASFSIAESQLPINLKYDVANKRQFKSFLERQGYKKIENLSESSRDILKYLIAVNINERKTGINQYALDSLSETQIEKINSSFREKYAKNFIHQTETGNRYVTNENGEYLEPIFNDYTDDEKRHNHRINLVDKYLYEYMIEKKPMSRIRGTHRRRLKENMKNRIKYFADPKKVKQALVDFEEDQYIIKNEDSRLIKNKSLPELANDMTSLSKMGYGELFMRLIGYEMEGTYDPNNKQMKEDFQKKEEVKAQYNKIIHTAMEILEKIILNNEPKKIEERDSIKDLLDLKKNKEQRLIEIDEKIYLLPLDPLREEINNEHLLRTTTGVFGGIITKTRLLPGDYGILFTALHSLKDGTYKISARINSSPKQKVHLGKFYESTTKLGITESGGGHPEAASCIIKEENLNRFVAYAKQQLTTRKKK